MNFIDELQAKVIILDKDRGKLIGGKVDSSVGFHYL